ncbi:hypothetical protein DES41_102283 [Pseudorhodoferax soli]|uniref:Uncharacterized protein n=1 Tax=Pseudorhodoferax soli TaxID=545864 RepID=A0A368Y3N1_9BURK|nr:hypothetical protein DES41_102283 [Pseudorhodoferax soli]
MKVPCTSPRRAQRPSEAKARTPGRAQRWPDCDFPLCPCRGAQCHGLRGASRASTSDSLRLFELSERSERCELRNAAHGASTAGCPERSAGTGAPGSPSFAYFSWRSKKSKSPCGGEYPASSSRSARGVHRPRCASLSTWGRDVPPAVQSLSLAIAQEKVTKEKATPVPPSLRWRSGQPAVLAAWAHCTTRTTHCVRSARTSAMSQLLKREVPRAAQSTALLGVGTGVGAGSHTGHRCARPLLLLRNTSITETTTQLGDIP